MGTGANLCQASMGRLDERAYLHLPCMCIRCIRDEGRSSDGGHVRMRGATPASIHGHLCTAGAEV